MSDTVDTPNKGTHVKSTIIAAGVLAALAFPAAADAHYSTVSVACDAQNVVGTYSFQSFPWNSTANEHLLLDGNVIKSDTALGLQNALQTRTLSAPLPVDGKTHLAQATDDWTADGGGRSASAVVQCASPTPPPAPTPVAPPTLPAPTPVAPVPPPHKGVVRPGPVAPRCPDTSNKRYNITVKPRHASHGLVHFRFNGPYVRHVRWYVDMKRRHTARFETVGRRTYSVWLFNTDVFGNKLWGWHWITAQAAVGPKGCGHVASARLKYFNDDPRL